MDKDELRSYDLRAEEMSINLTANLLRVSLLMASPSLVLDYLEEHCSTKYCMGLNVCNTIT